MTSSLRRAIWVLVVLLLAGPLAACGPSANEPGGLEGQVLGLLAPTEQPVLLPGAVIAIAGPGGTQTTTTDTAGKYRFAELRPGDYGLAASYTGPLSGDKPLQPEERQFSVSPDQDETISLVLLAEGITPPEAPPPAPSGATGQTGARAGVGGGLVGDPFFWYFLFNQPYRYGYGRPPVVFGPGGRQGPIVIDDNQPQRSSSGRTYTNYDDGSTTGLRTKPVPAITSKGTTRPGSTSSANGASGAGVRPPNPSNPGTGPAAKPPSATDSGSNGSRGVTRPGGSSPAPSVRPPTSRPPAARPPSRPSGRGRR
jgi:hypothetical protein